MRCLCNEEHESCTSAWGNVEEIYFSSTFFLTIIIMGLVHGVVMGAKSLSPLDKGDHLKMDTSKFLWK